MTDADLLFLIDGNDVIMFRDKAGAEAFIEPYDVRPGQDAIFQSDGTLLRIVASGRRVTVTPDIVGSDATRLAEALRKFLLNVPRTRTLSPEDIGNASLTDLVTEFERTERKW